MGVTKKKAYLKPEITKFEMKMETSFLAGSRETIEIPDVDEEGDIIDFTAALGPECTQGGTYSNIAAGGCETFGINSLQKEDVCQIWPLIKQKWPNIQKGDKVCICHKIDENGQSHYYASLGECTNLTAK